MKKRSSPLSSDISMSPRLVHGKMVGLVLHVHLEVEGSFALVSGPVLLFATRCCWTEDGSGRVGEHGKDY